MPAVWCIACESGFLAPEAAPDFFCQRCGVWIWSSDPSQAGPTSGQRSAQVVRGDEAVAPVRPADEQADVVSTAAP